jgi:hypothetical protein
VTNSKAAACNPATSANALGRNQAGRIITAPARSPGQPTERLREEPCCRT